MRELCNTTEKTPDIFCLTESKLSPDSSEISLLNYTLFRLDRNRHGGSVIIYVTSGLDCTSIDDLPHVSSSELERVAIKVAFRNKAAIICCIYRPPSAKAAWRDKYNEMLDCLQLRKLPIIICGDFDIDAQN